VGNKIVLERFSTDSIQKAFEELEEIAPNIELDTVKIGGDRYVDREYALRKIELQSTS
jgi:ribosomal protein S7